MKKAILILIANCFFLNVFAQTYWQQKVDYVIDVQLNDKNKTLDGFVRINYTNNSPDTLSFIWIHLWPNAYKNDRTAYSEQQLQNGSTDFYFSDKEKRGYINQLNFKVDGITATTQDHPQHIDVIKLLLPKPLPPNNSISITSPFHVKLPFNFSRSGYDGTSFQATQWYPKPAVYDAKGWHPMPYLDQGEFYSEFGSLDVRITVPVNYVVAATGNLQNPDELEWLKENKKGPGASSQKNKQSFSSNTATKTLQFRQDSIHDFAWFANDKFQVDHDTCMLSSGKIVDVFSYYTAEHAENWKKSVQYAKDALRFYSDELGNYPYDVFSVVQGPPSFGGGMEYPTITIISSDPSEEELDRIIAHELGHNWFYGILASNERMHPWMDEGMNSFYENKYMLQKYGEGEEGDFFLYTKTKRKTDQPIATGSEHFSSINYGVIAYYKTAKWMQALEKKLGVAEFKNMMQQYYETWKFKHPQPEDFKTIASKWLGNDTEFFFAQLYQKGNLAGDEPKGFTIIHPLQKNFIQRYIDHPTKNALLIAPALGYNRYNKLMVGALFSNYKLPPNNFQYLFIPMYGTGSKSFAGLARLNYSMHSDGAIRKIDLFMNASRFAMNNFTDNTQSVKPLHFSKLVPGARLTFRDPHPRSTTRFYVQWKTFFINEESVRVSVDTVFQSPDTLYNYKYNVLQNNRSLNQLQFTLENARALYPYEYKLQLEHTKDFIRPTLTAEHFFNYPKGGGLNVRFFAGKFIYLGGRTFSNAIKTDRFHLNMSGPDGSEDYTYSDYFIGRNDFQNLPSRQMMIRDGAFKVRTDLFGRSKVGKSDDWLMAVNFNTTIPKKLNPLSVLPVKIPLRLFADIGTYAEPWQKKNTELERFLFDAGLQVNLLKNVVNIYFPIVSSKAFREYYKFTYGKNIFLRSVNFSINLYTKDLKIINREIEF